MQSCRMCQQRQDRAARLTLERPQVENHGICTLQQRLIAHGDEVRRTEYLRGGNAWDLPAPLVECSNSKEKHI